MRGAWFWPVDYWPRHDELPIAYDEVLDEVLRQVRGHEAVYLGLGAENNETRIKAHAASLLERKRWLLSMVGTRRWAGGRVPAHTCSYWKTYEGNFCSMCGRPL